MLASTIAEYASESPYLDPLYVFAVLEGRYPATEDALDLAG
jgi:hypothetical protein